MMRDLVDFGILGALYVLVFYRRWKARGRDVLLVNTTMYVYLVFVLYFTLMPVVTALPFMFDHPYVPMNMSPFIDVVTERGDFVRQIVLNVVMMVPFGFLWPLVDKNAKLWKTVVCTFLLSLGIELLQPLLSSFRQSDVTDLITNVWGGLIGYGIYVVMRPLTTRVMGLVRGESS